MNSTLRALDAEITGDRLATAMFNMGMHLFDREEPDGWPERGSSWIGTTTLLERIDFARSLAENQNNSYEWETAAVLEAAGIETAEEIIGFFDEAFFQGALTPNERCVLREFVETGEDGQPLPLDPSESGYLRRVEELIGLMLSQPRWNFQ